MNDKLIYDAIEFALAVHKNDTRKGTETPYIFHPLEAGAIASGLTNDPEVIAAALLHDTVEDAHVTTELLEFLFGKEVARLVGGDSEDKSKTWQERKQATIDEMADSHDIKTKIVVMSDKLANLRTIQRDYRKQGESFWQRFNEKDPLKHKWYYSSFLDVLKELEDTDAYSEYARRIEETFGGMN